MARVLGESARYVTKESIKRYQRQFILIILVSFCFAFVFGSLFSYGITEGHYWWLTISSFIVAFIGLVLSFRFTDRVSERLETERVNYRKGIVGELLIGYILEGLPDDYKIIPGIKADGGDIDHVLVGPTGIFAIDTKDWRGIIKGDGKGELLWNGRATDKREVNNLVRRTMFIKDKIKPFVPAANPFIHAVLVFPAARIEIKKEQTGKVDCVRADQLSSYIAKKSGKQLSKKDIEAISQALDSLPHG